MSTQELDTLTTDVKASFASSLGIDASLIEIEFVAGSIIMIVTIIFENEVKDEAFEDLITNYSSITKPR